MHVSLTHFSANMPVLFSSGASYCSFVVKIFRIVCMIVMQQSFVSTAPSGPGNSGAFTFRFSKPCLKPCTLGPPSGFREFTKILSKEQRRNNKRYQLETSLLDRSRCCGCRLSGRVWPCRHYVVSKKKDAIVYNIWYIY